MTEASCFLHCFLLCLYIHIDNWIPASKKDTNLGKSVVHRLSNTIMFKNHTCMHNCTGVKLELSDGRS